MAKTIQNGVTHRSLIRMLIVAILVLSPFGRIGLDAASAMPMAGHCTGAPAGGDGKGQPAAVDCMIACAAIAPSPAALDLAPLASAGPAHSVRPALFHPGLARGTDPPPPRMA